MSYYMRLSLGGEPFEFPLDGTEIVVWIPDRNNDPHTPREINEALDIYGTSLEDALDTARVGGPPYPAPDYLPEDI